MYIFFVVVYVVVLCNVVLVIVIIIINNIIIIIRQEFSIMYRSEFPPLLLSDLFSPEPEKEDAEVESEAAHRDQDKVHRAGQEHLEGATGLGKLTTFRRSNTFLLWPN